MSTKKIGHPRGREFTKQFTTAYTPEQYLALNERALYENSSMGEIVRRAVVEYLRHRQRLIT